MYALVCHAWKWDERETMDVIFLAEFLKCQLILFWTYILGT